MLALYHFGPVANSLTPLLCLIEKGLDFDDRFLNSRLSGPPPPCNRAQMRIQQVKAVDGRVPYYMHPGWGER